MRVLSWGGVASWQVLRAAGYSRHALIVARAAGQADWELDILTEDLAAWDDALALMVRVRVTHAKGGMRAP